MVNNSYLRKCPMLLAVYCVLSVQAVNAAEWLDSYESKSGFSEFAPPSSFSGYRDDNDEKDWSSGRSFNQEYKVRYSPRVSKNPWKPVKSSSYKKTFGGQRPWGNVPERKPRNNNMKLHDQRFTQWLNRRDPLLRNHIGRADPLMGHGYPGSIYGSPLITPALYSGSLLDPLRLGGYPGGLYPYSGLSGGRGFW